MHHLLLATEQPEWSGHTDFVPPDMARPVEALSKVVRFMWGYYQRNPEFITLLNTENLHRGKHIAKSERAREFSSPAVAVLGQVLASGVPRPVGPGGFTLDDPEQSGLLVAQPEPQAVLIDATKPGAHLPEAVAKYAAGMLPFFFIPWPTALFGLAAALLIGLASGIVPALQAAGMSVIDGLRKVV